MPPMKGQFQFRHEYIYIVLFHAHAPDGRTAIYAHSAWRRQKAAIAQTGKLRKRMGRKGAKIMGLTWVRQEVLD